MKHFHFPREKENLYLAIFAPLSRLLITTKSFVNFLHTWEFHVCSLYVIWYNFATGKTYGRNQINDLEIWERGQSQSRVMSKGVVFCFSLPGCRFLTAGDLTKFQLRSREKSAVSSKTRQKTFSLFLPHVFHGTFFRERFRLMNGKEFSSCFSSCSISKGWMSRSEESALNFDEIGSCQFFAFSFRFYEGWTRTLWREKRRKGLEMKKKKPKHLFRVTFENERFFDPPSVCSTELQWRFSPVGFLNGQDAKSSLDEPTDRPTDAAFLFREQNGCNNNNIVMIESTLT